MTSYRDERRAIGRVLVDEMKLRVALNREPSDAELDYLGDILTFADVESLQESQWATAARHFAERVASGSGTREEISLFWIRFVGIFLDLAPRWRTWMKSAGERDGAMVAASPMFQMVESLLEATERLATAIPSDELFYAEYRRHVECHPRQTHYRARVTPNGLLDVTSKALGDARTQAESEDTLRRVLLRYDILEDKIAVSIAQRVVGPLRDVEAAVRRLTEPVP